MEKQYALRVDIESEGDTEWFTKLTIEKTNQVLDAGDYRSEESALRAGANMINEFADRKK